METAPPSRLMNRNFFLLWQGQFVSQLGNQAFAIAMMYWTMRTTGSATLVGLLMMLSLIPAVLLGPVGGTVADWYSRRSIIIRCDALSGLAVLSLAVLLLATPRTELAVTWLALVAVCLGTVRAFFYPAIAAAIPDLVPAERLGAANSLSASTRGISSILGQGVGGILFSVLGAPLLFLADGISYLFSATSEAFIQIPHHGAERKAGLRQALRDFKRDTWEGLLFVWGRKGMRNFVAATALLHLFQAPIIVLLPFYVEFHLEKGVEWYGFLLASMSVGALAGFALAPRVLHSKGRSWMLTACILIFSPLLAALGLTGRAVVALAVMLVTGGVVGVIGISIQTLLQISTPAELRGRTMALFMTVVGGVMPLGMAVGGILGDVTDRNTPLIFIVSGCIATIAVLPLILNRECLTFLSTPIPSSVSGGQ